MLSCPGPGSSGPLLLWLWVSALEVEDIVWVPVCATFKLVSLPGPTLWIRRNKLLKLITNWHPREHLQHLHIYSAIPALASVVAEAMRPRMLSIHNEVEVLASFSCFAFASANQFCVCLLSFSWSHFSSLRPIPLHPPRDVSASPSQSGQVRTVKTIFVQLFIN